ncbi:MAG TPA: DeoR/GlpR family DNA-binding transcription regulator [bacterium]|nr:DeoR/GlpR family DNA-binding transcription regulator [bacterium]
MGIEGIKKKEIIRELIQQKGKLAVSEITNILKVSEVTARKYLKELEKENVLSTTYGGALLKKRDFAKDCGFGENTSKNRLEKRAIAAKAFSLIKEGQTIFLDIGTTVFELSRLIRKIGLGIVVVTNSMPAISELINNENVETFVLGGMYGNELMGFSGSYARIRLERMYFDQSFLRVEGISSKLGLTEKDHYASEIQDIVIKNSGIVNLLASSSKIGKNSLIQSESFQKIKNIKRLITDSKADKNELEQIRKKWELEIIRAVTS